MRPLPLCSLCFLAALVLSDFLSFPPALFLAPLPLLVTFLCRPRRTFWVLLLFWFLAGWGWGSWHFHQVVDSALLRLLGEHGVYTGRVTAAPRPMEEGYQLRVALEKEETIGPTSGLVLLSSPLAMPALQEGDQIRFDTRLRFPTWYKNPGSFNYRHYLARQGILLRGSLEEPQDLQDLSPKPLPSSLEHFRRWITDTIGRATPFPGAAVLASLITGETAAIPEEVVDNFRQTGTLHLLAISGQNIGMLAFFFYFPILWLLKRSERILLTVSVRSLATLLTLIPVVGYVLLAGSPVSAVRAGLVYGLMVLALWLGRRFDWLSALAAAALGVCLFDPSVAFSISFQLSFAAVLAIGWFSEPCAGWIPGPRWFARLLSQTLVATLGTMPILLYHFGQVPLIGVVTNLWAVPLMTVILGGLLLGIGVAPFTLLVLHGVGELTRFLLWGLAWFAKYSLMMALPIFSTSGNGQLQVHFLDVGQGDAALVLTPHGHAVLIDAGGFLIPGRPVTFDVGAKVVAPYLQRVGVKQLDRLILSHPHPDHFGGMPAIVRQFPIGEFWYTGEIFPDVSFDKLLSELQQHGVPIQVKRAPESVTIDDVTFRVLAPTQLIPRDINDNSLVVQVSYGTVRFLFTGDLEQLGEERLLAQAQEVSSQVVKVPHHASQTSSSVPFIDMVHPQYAVASLGEGNMFHFPRPGVLEKYQRRGVKVFRIDQNGAVIFKTDGQKIIIRPFIDLP